MEEPEMHGQHPHRPPGARCGCVRAGTSGKAGAEVHAVHAGPADAAASRHRLARARGLAPQDRRLRGPLARPLGARGTLSGRGTSRLRFPDDAQGHPARLCEGHIHLQEDRPGHARGHGVPLDLRHEAARPLHREPLQDGEDPPRLRGGLRRVRLHAPRLGARHARGLLPRRHQDRGGREQVRLRVGEVREEEHEHPEGEGACPPPRDRRARGRGGGARSRDAFRGGLRPHGRDCGAHRPEDRREGRREEAEGRRGEGPEARGRMLQGDWGERMERYGRGLEDLDGRGRSRRPTATPRSCA